MASAIAQSTPASTLGRIMSRAPAYWRYTQEKPWWFFMFVFARFPAARWLERKIHRASYQNPVAVSGSLFGHFDMGRMVQTLVNDGVCGGLSLPRELVRQIREFADDHECFSRDQPTIGIRPDALAEANRKRERDVVAAYYFESVEQSTAVQQIYSDPALISIATAYLGHPAVLIRTRLWWSFPAVRVSDDDLHAAAQEKFHFDMNGWRTLKFFFYLTPTTEESGAHRCIVGSHRDRPIRHQFTMTLGRPTEELEKVYPATRFRTITGDAGTGFAEDPFVFHTGSLCRQQPRLVLELEYAATASSPSYRYGRMG